MSSFALVINLSSSEAFAESLAVNIGVLNVEPESCLAVAVAEERSDIAYVADEEDWSLYIQIRKKL